MLANHPDLVVIGAYVAIIMVALAIGGAAWSKRDELTMPGTEEPDPAPTDRTPPTPPSPYTTPTYHYSSNWR